jgi:hypothetical protein
MAVGTDPSTSSSLVLWLARPSTVPTTELERQTAGVDPSARHPGLALDHGLAVHRASLQWAEQTIAALSAAPAASP